MLIVGTRGRSLGGFQGLVSNRNSFSKWCLQYSPIPVVVVRPPEKREKKKLKRANDPTRNNYLQILEQSARGVHESVSSPRNSLGDIEILPPMSADKEAHEVAAALGLPARFDPTLKPLKAEGPVIVHRIQSRRSDAAGTNDSPDSRPSSPALLPTSPRSTNLDSPMMSEDGEDDSDDDEEGEFEVVAGQTLLGNTDGIEKKEKLHQMEVGEAAALAGRKVSIGSNDSISVSGGADDDDEG
jgi:hypothetical protein